MRNERASSLIGNFAKTNPFSTFWSLLVVIDCFISLVTPMQSIGNPTSKLVWLAMIIVVTIGLFIVIKRNLFTSINGEYGIENLTIFVDEHSIIYFFLCCIFSMAIGQIFMVILKDVFISFV